MENKNVFVTGAGGFIGSHLVDELLNRGSKVLALVHYNSRNSWGLLEQIENKSNPNLKVILGDINDSFMLNNLTKDIDYVFHLAALIGIPYSYDSPNSYINTNIMGSNNLFQACLGNNVRKIIHTSTSEVYGTAKYVPIDEKHPLQGQSPYSASKISADMLAMSYAKSFNLPVVTLRPFNTFGPRQSARAIIPSVVSQILIKNEVEIGDPSPLRDFNFVLDTVNGFLALAESELNYGEVFNLSSGKQISIGDLVKLICSIIGSKVIIKQNQNRFRPKNSEVLSLLGNCDKLKQNTKWIKKYSLEDGLKQVIKYIDSNIHLYKANGYIV